MRMMSANICAGAVYGIVSDLWAEVWARERRCCRTSSRDKSRAPSCQTMGPLELSTHRASRAWSKRKGRQEKHIYSTYEPYLNVHTELIYQHSFAVLSAAGNWPQSIFTAPVRSSLRTPKPRAHSCPALSHTQIWFTSSFIRNSLYKLKLIVVFFCQQSNEQFTSILVKTQMNLLLSL